MGLGLNEVLGHALQYGEMRCMVDAARTVDELEEGKRGADSCKKAAPGAVAWSMRSRSVHADSSTVPVASKLGAERRQCSAM